MKLMIATKPIMPSTMKIMLTRIKKLPQVTYPFMRPRRSSSFVAFSEFFVENVFGDADSETLIMFLRLKKKILRRRITRNR